MYHQVGNPRPWSRWPGLFVRTSDFAAQLHALLAHGWTAITAATLGDAMQTGQAVPAKSFVITIDDGELSSWTGAFPILQRDCVRATFYVPAAFVGTPGHITAPDLAAIARAGDEIGNHSMTHVNLGSPRLTTAMLLLQTLQAAARLQADLAARGVHVPITTFAYPSGRFAAPVVGLLRQLGYTLAVTTAHGEADIGTTQPLLTPRIRVARGETARDLLAEMP
jgi:peptidoglycan/xylan/chitin deacetylase (PgdA/CDA1 family)